MAIRRRSASYDATLVYVDEPQVITLLASKTRIVAIAIPDEDHDKSMFLATTVKEYDWKKYLSGTVDLRYLFTYPKVHSLYCFDLYEMSENKVMMTPFEGVIEERFLPLPRFFSTNHTSDYDGDERATDKEQLFIDGEWELQDFGQFQQKYADIYAFVIATDTWMSRDAEQAAKRRIKDAFMDRPFKGGFSYVHLFRDLNDNVPPGEQLNLSKIKYASPGTVEILGKEKAFENIHIIIPNFLERRNSIEEKYNRLMRYLSDNRYIQMDGDRYPKGDPTEGFMKESAQALANEMQAPDFDAVWDLTDENALVASKVVLSFYRRLRDAATYFAQGRIAFDE